MTFVGGSVYEGGNRRLGPPILTPLSLKNLHNRIEMPLPYAIRISEALRIYFVNKSMLLRSTTKPPIL